MSKLKIYINDRVEALTRFILTRRPDVFCRPINDGSVGFLASTMTESNGIGMPRNYCPFFGFAFGTEVELRTAADANRYSNECCWNHPDDRRFCAPVLSLIFSMVDDRGYHGWYAEPTFENDQPILVHHAKVTHAETTKSFPDTIVDAVVAWYDALSHNLVREAESHARPRRKASHA